MMLNIDVTNKGELIKRRGWRSFWGMVYELWKINQKFQKNGYSGDFTVRLPLKWGRSKRVQERLGL